ncbi:MAG: hypothetical protein ACM3MM_05345 [Acidobacteriota bacterium]
MAFCAAAIVAYWVEYFSTGRVRTSDDPSYVDFENAFPLADVYMAACLAAGSWHLWRGNVRAVPIGIAAGSALVFVGAMDTLWNLQHRAYRQRSTEMAIETAINVASLTFGPITMVRLWRRRHALA